MRINNSYTSTVFSANLNSPKLRFKQDDFFVRIRGYGKNREWAGNVIKTTDNAVNLIRKNVAFENVLRFITAGIISANRKTLDAAKKEHSGVLRVFRDGWKFGSEWNGRDLWTPYGTSKTIRYNSYADRFDEVYTKPLTKPYDDVELTRPIRQDDTKALLHCDEKFIDNGFKHFSRLYEEFQRYTKLDVKQEHLAGINDCIAETRWLLAHITPWERGSDAISNVFMRAMYKAIGVKTFPLAKGVSLDLEAYCTELEEYKRKFAGYFEKAPEVVE